MQWWCTWYPGAEPGGGGYIAQRMFSTKSDKDAVKSTLLFNIAHYVVRPWPWIIVALCAMLIFPEMSLRFNEEGGTVVSINEKTIFIETLNDNDKIEIEYHDLSPIVNIGDKLNNGDMLFDAEQAYPLMIMKLLPVGLRSLLIVSFIAAFMSTVSTHLNWGSSYIVNDVYARFIKPKRLFDNSIDADKHYMLISRLTCIGIAILGIIVSYFFNSVKDGWEMIIGLGAGTGLVYMLRWYWWRINAWSEISAMLFAFIGSIITSYMDIGAAPKMIFITLFTTIGWIVVTISTKPEPDKKLTNFYNLVKPATLGWSKFATGTTISVKPMINNVFISILIVNTSLFGIGNMFFANYSLGIIMIAVASLLLYRLINRINDL